MEFNDFAESARGALERMLKLNVSVENIKVGNEKHTALVVTEGGIRETLYLEVYYYLFQNGMSMEGIVKNMQERYKKYHLSRRINADDFKDFNKIKHNIMYGLVGYERNKDCLMKVPHRRYLDMTVIYFYMVDLSEGLYFKVTNEYMDAWGVNENILYETAKHYTVKMFPALFRSMEKCILDNILYCVNNGEISNEELPEVIASCLKKSPEEISLPKGEDISIEELENCIMQLFDEAVRSNNSNMYVLSNGAFGAVCILYKNCLKTIADSMGSDLYILPSSVREMVLIPVDKVTDINVLREMVLDVTNNIINADDVLTDSIYVYSRENGSIDIV